MSVRTFPEPASMKKGITGVCKWGCGKPVKKPALYWHPECLQDYLLHTRLEEQYAFLVERDGKVCGSCGEAPAGWVRGDVGICCDWSKGTVNEDWLRELWFARYELPASMEERRATGLRTSIEWRIRLEVDHLVPLWSVAHLPDDERRRFFGPENLWLLCPDCHKKKTAYEAADRAAERKAGRGG